MGTSRRDYELIARALFRTRTALAKVTTNRTQEATVQQTFDVMTLVLADDFAATFKNFDRDKFLFAVYVDDMDKYERMRASSVELPDS